jgi:hypothetical protein
MRHFVLGGMIALAFSGAALAHDFIVVGSSDPAIHKGEALDAGSRVSLAPGRTLTLIRTSGEVMTLTGSLGGVTLPGASVASADPARFNALHALFQAPPAGRTFGARRGFCPGAEALTTLDSILQADKSGCKRASREAFQAYLKKAGAPDADSLYATPAVDGAAPSGTGVQPPGA